MVQRISRAFKDISLSFDRHPVTNDILNIKNEDLEKWQKEVVAEIERTIKYFAEKENIATRAMPTSTMVFNTHGDDCSVSEDPQVRHLCHGEIKS